MKKVISLFIVFILIGTYAYSQVPQPPTLIAPPDSAINVTLFPTLDWSDVPTATSYRVQVSTSPNFSTTIVNTVTGTNSQYTITTAMLTNNTLYYWRANATNQNGTGQWSSVWRFTTIVSLPPPPNVYLVNGGNPVYHDSATVFKWAHVPTATAYKIQISNFVSFTNPLIEVVVFDTLYIAPPGTFNYGTVYYWRVAAINNGGQGPWSSLQSFTVFVAPPSAPVLICDTANVPLNPILNWNDVPTATIYRVQVSASPTFTSTIINATVTISQYTVPSGVLSYSSHYYWRVNATNSGGTGPWSTICSFTTINQSGIINISSEIPAENKLYSNYPNPFNSMCNVQFSIARHGGSSTGNVKIVVYDIMGREVQTLVNERLQPGTYEATFDGSQLASGIYFYKLMVRHGGSSTDGFTETKKMLMIK